MIEDFNDSHLGTCLKADLCIIGAGALGIAIALEFSESNIQVLVLESGGLKPEASTQSLYDSEIIGMPHSGTHSGRARIFGGTTTLWGGQALPLAEIDFAYRPWVDFSGWAISYAELSPYYRRAEELLKLDRLSYEDAPWLKFNITPPAYDREKFLPYFSKWSPQPNFAVSYINQLQRSKNISILLHANAIEILSDPHESYVKKLKIKSLSGKSDIVEAQTYIICTGGIETARLLLASNHVNPMGLGNSHDLVGRFFQDHVSIKCGEILPRDRSHFQNIYDQFYLNQVKYYHKITASEQFQTQQKILNVAAHIYFEYPQDSGVLAAKRILKLLQNRKLLDIPPADVGYVLKDIDDIFKVAKRFLIEKRSFSPKRGKVYLEAHVEQAPSKHSLVSLSNEIDILGMPKLKINWQISEQTYNTAFTFSQALAQELRRLELADVRLSEYLTRNEEPEDFRQKFCYDLNHHMGTTRMDENPEKGVVNSQCLVHGFNNLYIAGSAVFPTSGYSNPTLTALALGLRLSDHLKSKILAPS